ncbi:MAG: L-2-amino-thiazoline-4-carboxylic acid hydrolase [Thermodesulfobacteriota bacterium]
MECSSHLISKEEAGKQVRSIIDRLALLYYAFAKALIAELGEEKGRTLIKEAIQAYGEIVGKRVRERTLTKDLPLEAENFQDDLPALGWAEKEVVEVEGEKRARIYLCPLAKSWQELGAAELGRIYCFVDQAKYAAYNPELICVHTKNVLDGDSFCEIAVRKKRAE